jgi:hypothetical protein
LERPEYLSGDRVVFRCECDNSDCKFEVKSFKYKLIRQLTIRCQNQTYQEVNYVSTGKLAGMPGKAKETKTFEFRLPENAFVLSKEDMIRQSGCSFSGKLWAVQYQLNIYVRHDTIHQTGQGDYRAFPIRVHQTC